MMVIRMKVMMIACYDEDEGYGEVYGDDDNVDNDEGYKDDGDNKGYDKGYDDKVYDDEGYDYSQ